MKKLTPFLILCSAIVWLAACKKSSNSSATPPSPASSTQWTYDNKSYKGGTTQTYYDTTGMFFYLGSSDTTGANGLALAFYEPSVSVQPTPGKYYFVNYTASNIPNGVSPTQICIMEVGPSSSVAYSVGGTAGDTATVSYNPAGKIVVFFNNITTTTGAKASGTLVE